MERLAPATPADLPGVAAIYAEAAATSIATFDLEPRAADYWRPLVESPEPGDHLLVARDGDEVVGYASASAYRPRPAYRHTRETSVYLAPAARGRGLGRRLYDALLARMATEVHTAVALVALPNDASVALHVACGFRHVGTMTEVGHKFGRWIDTAWYELRLDGPG